MNSHVRNQVLKVHRMLQKSIYGQEAAIRAASSLEAARMVHQKRVMLFAGPTGCGKTEIFRTLGKATHNVYIVDCSSLTAAGWKGGFKTESIFSTVVNQIYQNRSADEKSDIKAFTQLASYRINRSIIVLDEIDKSLLRAGGDFTEHQKLCGELLALLEGKILELTYDKNPVYINTGEISFVLIGAFQEIFDRKKKDRRASIGFGSSSADDTEETCIELTVEDFINFGILPELIGRLDRIVTLRGMSEDDYVAAMLDSDLLCNQSTADLNADAVIEIAHEAYRQGLGLRWVKKELQRREDDAVLKEIGIG